MSARDGLLQGHHTCRPGSVLGDVGSVMLHTVTRPVLVRHILSAQNHFLYAEGFYTRRPGTLLAAVESRVLCAAAGADLVRLRVLAFRYHRRLLL